MRRIIFINHVNLMMFQKLNREHFPPFGDGTPRVHKVVNCCLLGFALNYYVLHRIIVRLKMDPDYLTFSALKIYLKRGQLKQN